MARSRKAKARKAQRQEAQREARRKAERRAQKRNLPCKTRLRTYSRAQDHFIEPIQEDKDKKQDALDYAVSGGHFESNRRRH